MRSLLALAGLALGSLVLQCLLAALLPPALVPDLTLLVTVIAAVEAPALPALLLAASLGFGMDVLSGSLLGEHALLRILVFAATRFVSAQFHLERGLPLATYCLAIGLLAPLGLAALSRLFTGQSLLGVEALPTLTLRASVGALLATSVHRVVGATFAALQDGDARRREVRFDTRRPVL